VDGTVRVFPLRKDGAPYGAVLSGEHRFHVREGSGPERLDGQARFTHLWRLEDGTWRMARILSYDHGPARYASPRQAVVLPPALLDAYVGTYKSRQMPVAVRRKDAGLVVAFGPNEVTLHAESERVFFVKERDLVFEFVRPGPGPATAMRVLEKGALVEEAPRQ
jgi:hypothetical protein